MCELRRVSSTTWRTLFGAGLDAEAKMSFPQLPSQTPGLRSSGHGSSASKLHDPPVCKGNWLLLLLENKQEFSRTCYRQNISLQLSNIGRKPSQGADRHSSLSPWLTLTHLLPTSPMFSYPSPFLMSFWRHSTGQSSSTRSHGRCTVTSTACGIGTMQSRDYDVLLLQAAAEHSVRVPISKSGMT